MAVDLLLNLLSRALDNQQNQDLKLLLKRNEELSQELQEESKGRDAVHIELVTAESTIRKLESEKQRLEDMISDLKENQDLLKREVIIEKNKVTRITQEKEVANDEIQTLRNQCELLASRLGDPERKLLQENSRLSSEKHNVQISLSKERQSFLDRLQQMEMALDDLNAEKDELMENKCKEIRDLKAEMEAMEKQLQSNKKFIDEQAQEREQEREDYLKELNKMQEIVREKEKIQSNEGQLMKEIESLEQVLRARIQDHQNVMQKKDMIENELRQSVDKIRDLRDVIEELEKQLNIKTKTETELRQKLSTLTEAVNVQERRNSVLDDEIAMSKNVKQGSDSTEQVQNLKERLACQSQEIEEMSQTQTLLHELRGQLHFLEAKVEQRAKQLEAMHLSHSPVQSSDTSPSSSQESESLHLPCEDGWEMSPRSIHWLEVRRLEEKIGRLVHIDEELIKRNKELEQKLKRLQLIQTECEQENAALQEKLSEQLMQVSALKSHIDEQKHRSITPLKSQAITKKMEELQEANEVLRDNIERLSSELHEKRGDCDALREEMEKKEYLIAMLQRNASSTLKQKEELNTESSACFKLLLLEKEEELNSKLQIIESLQKQLVEFQKNVTDIPEMEKELRRKRKMNETLEKENTQLKSEVEMLKNEITSLKELLESSKKQVDSEQAQVQELCEKLANTTRDNKRLEQDLELVQNMMQQKERELETLHEETDAQMKLEADLETLEKELESQKAIEEELRHGLHKLENALETNKNVMKHENEQWKLRINDLEKSHELEVEKLKKQLDTFRKSTSSDIPEDIDISLIRDEIMEAAKAFNLENSVDKKEYENLVYQLLKKAVNTKLQLMQQKHEADISSINESWQQKVKDELETTDDLHSRCEKYKRDYLLLQERMKEETDKLCSERDAYWQSKLMEVKDSVKEELNESHIRELNFLQDNLEKISKEKTLIEMKAKSSSQKVEQLNKNLQVQREKILKEFQAKIPVIEQKLKERQEMEWRGTEEELKKQIENMQRELDLALNREKENELKHKEEIAGIHQLFETRWSNEMGKIMTLQMEELKKLNNSKEKNLEAVYNHLFADYGDKLKKLQKECALQLVEERRRLEVREQSNLQQIQQALEKRFEEEKRSILLLKERELSALAEALEEKKREILELKSMHLKNGKRDWVEEKQRMVSLHEEEISELRQKLQSKYERLLQNQLQARDTDMRNMEETYNQRLEEVSELLKTAKQAATGSLHSDSGSNRTTTPSSEITSSDEACSSCQEDMLVGNKHLLVNKIHQDGKRILNLVESSCVPSSAEREAFTWLEEKEWIIGKLKSLNNDVMDKQMNLKLVISNLCDEIMTSRKRINSFNDEIATLRRKCLELEDQISDDNSKLYILATNLSHQTKLNAELDSLLTSRTNEASELRRTLDENKLTAFDSSSRSFSQQRTNSVSSSCDVGQLRSADDPRSAERFAMFLPEAESSPPMKLNKTTEELYPESVKSLLEWNEEILTSPEEIGFPCDMRQLKNQSSAIHQELMSMIVMDENGLSSSCDAKIHGLYWVCRKSLSHIRSLIYQKKYLLMLLRGFQMTEKVTLSYVNQIGREIQCGPESSNSSFTADRPLRGCALFRSVAFVAVAVQRMKYYVRRWRLFARVPAPEIVNAEVQSVFQNYPSVSPSMTPCGLNVSFLSLSSKSASLCDYEQVHPALHSSASSVSSRTGTKPKRKSTTNQGHLIEYVQRLDTLQKQLGLDNLR